MRTLSPIDKLIMQADRAARTLLSGQVTSTRPSPASAVDDGELAENERELSVRLLRIDHTGEVCAQALYQGQALTARASPVREQLEQAADEECDHLAWCERRLGELDGRTSVLNPIFYAGSFAIGAVAGILGDRWSLGFVAETENQVSRHLEGHLQRISPEDRRSRAVLEQMLDDEQHHATTATAHGGRELPRPIRALMRLASKVMTRSTYWV